MVSIPHYYWDACVFIAHLNNEQDKHGPYVEHVQQFLDECRSGLCAIYTSTVTIAEIPANRLKSAEYGSFSEFLEDYQGSIIPVGADPNVTALAAQIRGLSFVKQGSRREVGTPDAIHLASALALATDYGVPVTAFHTFDNGKSKGPDGKTVPLLSFETWCDACRDDPLAGRIISMARTRPGHSNPRLPFPSQLPNTGATPPLALVSTANGGTPKGPKNLPEDAPTLAEGPKPDDERNIPPSKPNDASATPSSPESLAGPLPREVKLNSDPLQADRSQPPPPVDLTLDRPLQIAEVEAQHPDRHLTEGGQSPNPSAGLHGPNASTAVQDI
ncbi:hypothetical protein [Acidisphaera sp. S103]|uniref:type II toxin-antitoxin system VapC family toxin n=1 Tax=Acidisphaera sp. S103 TaxID=1747223 RepID=UPI001C203AE9|nr:hypothetical protein [Acidisphaera sp. S103]